MCFPAEKVPSKHVTSHIPIYGIPPPRFCDAIKWLQFGLDSIRYWSNIMDCTRTKFSAQTAISYGLVAAFHVQIITMSFFRILEVISLTLTCFFTVATRIQRVISVLSKSFYTNLRNVSLMLYFQAENREFLLRVSYMEIYNEVSLLVLIFSSVNFVTVSILFSLC